MPKTSRARGGTLNGAAQTQAQEPLLLGRRIIVRDGQIEWLAGDGGLADATLTRSAASTLSLTGGLSLTGSLAVTGEISYATASWQAFSDFGENYSAATSNSFGGTPYTLAGRVENDTVRLRGGITVGGSSTTSGDVMCVVPAALRPASPVILIASAAGAAGAVEVAANGNLICRRSGTAGTSYLSMDGLTYTLVAG